MNIKMWIYWAICGAIVCRLLWWMTCSVLEHMFINCGKWCL